MKFAKRAAWPSIIATIAAVAMLALLFTFPRKYLVNMTDEMDALAQSALDAVMIADWERAKADTAALEERLSQSGHRIKLFLNHEDVDELESIVMTARRLALIEDDAELLIQLERIRSTLKYIRGIEAFDLSDLI